MLKANIHDFKTHLSQYLTKVKAGEVVEICDRNVPVATVTAITCQTIEPRPLGLAKGLITVKDDFFDSLPEEVLSSFNNPVPAA
jgi:prevent-host-death family protein